MNLRPWHERKVESPMDPPGWGGGGGGGGGKSRAPAPAVLAPDAGNAPSEHVPPSIKYFIERLETFAAANLKDANRDRVFFWTLKIPTVVSSAFAGVTAWQGMKEWAALLAGIAALAAAVDILYPRAQLRNAHLRALYDLRKLQNDMFDDWTIGVKKGSDPSALEASILEAAKKKREEISDKVRDAEASLGQSASEK